MLMSEISEYIVNKYSDCCMAVNNIVDNGCREDWYEEYLVDELISFFMYEKLNLCGCGAPEYTYETIRRLLTIRKEWQDNNNIKYEDVIKRYLEDLHIDNDDDMQYGMLQFMMYVLDDKGMLEHGSSIGGCWLTNEGKMLLDVLNEWHRLDFDEE